MQGKFLSDCWVGRQSTLAGSRNVFSQISGRRQTFEELKQSDVWGFGAVLFFMISKTVPWSEHTLSREIVTESQLFDVDSDSATNAHHVLLCFLLR